MRSGLPSVVIDLLLVCTANRSRSPMAEAILTDRLRREGIAATVGSAGLLESGQPATSDALAVLTARGLDRSAHRSRRIEPELLGSADLVVALAREHVRAVAATAPAVWPRTFTLKELVRRGGEVGPRAEGQPVARWLEAVHEGRRTVDLLGASPVDDVADPLRRGPGAHERTYDELEVLLERLVRLLWPEGPESSHPLN